MMFLTSLGRLFSWFPLVVSIVIPPVVVLEVPVSSNSNLSQFLECLREVLFTGPDAPTVDWSSCRASVLLMGCNLDDTSLGKIMEFFLENRVQITSLNLARNNLKTAKPMLNYLSKSAAFLAGPDGAWDKNGNDFSGRGAMIWGRRRHQLLVVYIRGRFFIL